MTEADEKIAELQRQIDELKAGQAKREPKGSDLGDWGGGGRSKRLADQLCFPPEALKAMLDATPPDVMADLRADARRVTVKSFEPIERKGKGNGWYEPKPLTQVSVDRIDEIVNAVLGPAHGKPKAEPKETA